MNHDTKPESWESVRPASDTTMAVVDCHTHTHFSGDSSTSIATYVECFRQSGLTHVCITDHHSIAALSELREILEDQVISGQEVRVAEGEVIGLFVNDRIPSGMRLADASKAIREQGGIVYVCHPVDARRFSIDYDNLVAALDEGLVDAIELYNSKSLTIDPRLTEVAARFHVPLLGGSDSHVAASIGSSGAVMPWFDSAQTFLASAKKATPFGRFYDPRASWPLPVVPTTSYEDSELAAGRESVL